MAKKHQIDYNNIDKYLVNSSQKMFWDTLIADLASWQTKIRQIDQTLEAHKGTDWLNSYQFTILANYFLEYETALDKCKTISASGVTLLKQKYRATRENDRNSQIAKLSKYLGKWKQWHPKLQEERRETLRNPADLFELFELF